jgi:hypothetical protein
MAQLTYLSGMVPKKAVITKQLVSVAECLPGQSSINPDIAGRVMGRVNDRTGFCGMRAACLVVLSRRNAV